MHPNRQPKGIPTGGQFAASAHAESGVALDQPFDLYPHLGQHPIPGPVAVPVHPVSAVRPSLVSHVALGPGRRWATACGQADPRTGETCNELLVGETIGSVNSARAAHLHTEHRTDGTEVPLADEEWVTDQRHGVRACFVNLDEGWDGAFDPENPDDDNLLRIDVQVRPEHPEADAAENDYNDVDGDWCSPSVSASWCTQVRADHITPEQKRRLLRQAVQDLAEQTRRGASLGPLIASFEGMADSDVPRYETDSPTAAEAAQDRHNAPEFR